MGSTCYFCEKAPAESGGGVTVMMKKTLGQDGTKLYSQRMELKIPACRPCKEFQLKARAKFALVLLGVFLVPGFLGLIVGGGAGAMVGLGAGFFLAIAGSAAKGSFFKAHAHPEIVAMEKDGWYPD